MLVHCNLNVVWLLHTLRRSCTIWIVWLGCVFKGDNLHVFGWSNAWAYQKLKIWDFLKHHRCDKCQIVHDGTTHWALPVHYTFTVLVTFDIISRSWQCRTVLPFKLYVIIQSSWNFVGLLSTSSRSWITTVFYFHTYSMEIVDVSWFYKNVIVGFFVGTVQARFFKLRNIHFIVTLHGSTNLNQVWWPWSCFKVTGVSEP